MIKAYYATTDVGGYRTFQVVILDDEDQEQAGLLRTGYFEEIGKPDDGAAQGPDRA